LKRFAKPNRKLPNTAASCLCLLILIGGCGEKKPSTPVTTSRVANVATSVTPMATGSPGGLGATTLPGVSERHAGLATPDFQEKRAFKRNKASAEVLGVCKMTEEQLTCWDPAGKLDEKLRGKVAAQLSTYNGQEVPIKFQRQNRILLIRFSSPSSPLDPDVRPFGAFYMRDGKLTSCPARNLGNPDGKRRTTLDMSFALSMPLKVQDITQRFVISEAVRDSAELKCKIGAEAKFSGEMLKVTAIDQIEGAAWSIAIATKLGSRPLDLKFSFLDLKDRTIAWIDQTGKPYTEAEYLDLTAMRDPKAPPSSALTFTRLTDVYFGRSDGDLIKVMSRIDPKYIGKIALTGRTTKVVEIGPISLNPK